MIVSLLFNEREQESTYCLAPQPS